MLGDDLMENSLFVVTSEFLLQWFTFGYQEGWLGQPSEGFSCKCWIGLSYENEILAINKTLTMNELGGIIKIKNLPHITERERLKFVQIHIFPSFLLILRLEGAMNGQKGMKGSECVRDKLKKLISWGLGNRAFSQP